MNKTDEFPEYVYVMAKIDPPLGQPFDHGTVDRAFKIFERVEDAARYKACFYAGEHVARYRLESIGNTKAEFIPSKE